MAVEKVVFLKFPEPTGYQRLEVSQNGVDDLYKQVKTAFSDRLTCDFYLVDSRSKILRNCCDLSADQSFLEVRLCLKGGKGGYGALMKNQAAQHKKFTSTLAARYLDGRVVRDVKNEIRLKKWLKRRMIEQQAKKAQKEEEERLKQIQTESPEMLQAKQEAELKMQVIKNSISDAFKSSIFNTQTEQQIIEQNEPKTIDFVSILKSKVHGISKQHQQQKIKQTVQEEEDEKLYTLSDFAEVKSESMALSLPPNMMKKMLKDVGAKCGGTPAERALRIWEIAQKPERLMEKKYKA